MTREEASFILANIDRRVCDDELNEALDMAIKALEQESSYNSVNSLVESKLKNPKTKTFDILHFVADNAGLSTFEAIEKAYIMGVVEQEQILDKIRAEIIKYEGDCRLSVDEYPSCKQCTDNVFESIYAILDKYKAESEG